MTIIKFTLLKKHLDLHNYLDFFQDYMLKSLQDNKELDKGVIYKELPYEVYVSLQSLYLIVSEVNNNLNKIIVGIGVSDIAVDELSSTHRVLLYEFSRFLINFWSNGIKIFASFVYLAEDYNTYWYFSKGYFSLFYFWMDIPNFLFILKPIYFEVNVALNLEVDGFKELCLYLINNDSFLYIFYRWYCKQIAQKLYKNMFFYRQDRYLVSWMRLMWKDVSPEFLYYMFTLLKESNKNIAFNVKRKDEDDES